MDRAYSGSAASLPLSTILFSKDHTEKKAAQKTKESWPRVFPFSAYKV